MPQFGTFLFGVEKFGIYRAEIVYDPNAKFVLGAGGFVSQDAVINGSTIRGKDMLANQSLIDAVEGKISSYELKFYIQDKNYNWVDFSDRTNINGRNQLRKIGNMSYSSEGLQGSVRQRMSTLVLDSSDGFWTKPFPSSLYATYNSDWQWLGFGATAASFGYSYNRRSNTLYRHKVCLKANFTALGSDIPQEITLGVFLIDRARSNSSSRSHTLTLTSLEFPLVEAEASTVKNGTDWYINRPASYLVERLVKSVYTDNDAISLPSSYDIDNIVDYRVPDIDNTGWAISHAGRPPERTFERDAGGGFDSDPTWVTERSRLSRAICAHELTIETLSVVAGSEVVTTNGDLTTLDYSIIAGDVLTIPRVFVTGDGGSDDHFGHYEVSSVNTSTGAITLTTPVNGKSDESGLRWVVTRLYIGVGNDLYQYNQFNDSYYRLTESTGSERLDTNYTIRRLWFNPNDTTYPIWGVALYRHNSSTQYGDSMQIFRFRMNSTEPEFSTWGDPIDNVMFGEYYKEHPQRGVVSSSYYLKHFAGRFDDDVVVAEDRFAMPIIFDQHLANEFDHEIRGVFLNTSSSTKVPKNDVLDDSTYIDQGVSASWLRRGQYSAFWDPLGAGPGAVRTTFGQEGFLVFQSNWGTSCGSIVYAKHVFSGGSGVNYVQSDLETGIYEHTYHYIDLTGSSHSEQTLSMGTEWDGSTTVEKGQPTCGTADPDSNELWIGCIGKGVTGDTYQFSHVTWEKTTRTVDAFYVSRSGIRGIPIEYNVIDGYLHGVFVEWESGIATPTYMIAAFDNGSLTYSDPLYGYPWRQTNDTKSSLYGITPMSIYDTDMSAFIDVMFYIEADSQRLRYISEVSLDDTVPTSSIVEYSGFTQGETCSISNVYGSSNSMQLFWIGSPLPGYTVPDLAEGRFHLNQWSYGVVARIELADFTDLNVWDSIGLIAEKMDALYGFYPDGNFFFKRRPRHTKSEHTFTNVGSNQIADITVDSGYSEIVNSAVRSPSRVVISPAEITWEIGFDSKYGEDGYRHDIVINYKTLASRDIRLVCTHGGKVAASSSEAESATYDGARFNSEVVDASIATTLISSYTEGDNYLLLSDEFDVVYESLVRLNGRNQEQIDDGDLTIDSVWGDGRIGYIMQQSFENIVLSEDVTETTSIIKLELQGGGSVNLSNTLANGTTLSVGTIVVIGNLTDGKEFEYCQVIDISDTEIIAQRNVMPERGGRLDHESGDSIAIIRNGNVYFLRSGETGFSENYGSWAGVLFVAGDSVTIDLPSTGISSTNVLNENVASSGAHDVVSFIPVDDVYVEVGGTNTNYSTGVRLNFTFRGDDDNEPKFSAGDIIRINCKGLSLAQDATINHEYTDMGSVDVYTKRDSRGLGSNRFLNDDDARWIVRREVDDNRYPKHTFTVMCIVLPWLKPAQVVTIQSLEMLPLAVEHKEEVYISGIGFNLQHNGMMELTCRSVDPY